LTLCLLGVAPGVPPAAAQEAPPVNVRFSFSDPNVTGLFPSSAEQSRAETALSGDLARLFERSAAYWPARVAGEDTYPQLRLRLQADGSRWFVLIELLPVVGQPPTYAEQVEVFAPGEVSRLGGFPPIARLPGRIAEKMAAFYSRTGAGAALQAKLGDCAPLGSAAHVTRTATSPVAILPLKWERYCSLASSVFALEYELQSGRRVVVIGQGLGEPGLFTPDAPQFTGVMVAPKRWVSGGADDDIAAHLSDLGKLKPHFFRLKQLTLDVSACLDLGGATPSVAR
jgi:hypothetical protein